MVLIMFCRAFQRERRGCACGVCSHARRAVFAILRASCLGSSFELEGDLRCFGKPTTVFLSVVSVAGRDYAFENLRYDLDGGLIGVAVASWPRW